MRIQQIRVTGLFGIFDHTIPLKLEEKITIIHGPNGFGKTALLKMLDGLFNQRYSVFIQYPFSEFRVDFDDGTSIRVVPNISYTQKRLPLELDESEQISERKTIFVEIMGPNTPNFRVPLRDISVRISRYLEELFTPNFQRVDYDTWRFMPSGEILTIIDIIERYPEYVPPRVLREVGIEKEQISEWTKWQNYRRAIHIIDTNRLSMVQFSKNSPRRIEESTASKLTVVQYSEELAENIRTQLAKSTVLSQSLDRTFPNRLVKQSQSSNINKDNVARLRKKYDDLREKLNELEKKRLRLIDAGLLTEQVESNIQIPEPEMVNKTQLEFLTSVFSIHVKDVERKLSAFDEIADKIELLSQLVKKRFLYKKMSINKDKGFLFKTINGDTLPLESLSSGEQHELILLFELLFKVTPNSLILIDEPEISLHIAWQQEFLKDLQEITKLGQFDVLLSTHSPDIIYDRQDLAVSLTGPLEEKL